MPYINDSIRDNGLTSLASQTNRRMDICHTQEPANYTEATSTYTCGNETAITMSAITDGAVDGRRVTVPAITDGDVTASQTAGWWGLTDAASVLHAAGALSASQAVTSGNKFTLTATDITFRDAA